MAVAKLTLLTFRAPIVTPLSLPPLRALIVAPLGLPPFRTALIKTLRFPFFKQSSHLRASLHVLTPAGPRLVPMRRLTVIRLLATIRLELKAWFRPFGEPHLRQVLGYQFYSVPAAPALTRQISALTPLLSLSRLKTNVFLCERSWSTLSLLSCR